MKHIKIYESVINDPMIKFNSKEAKLDNVKNEINSFLTTSGKKINFNYCSGSKGLFFTNLNSELVNQEGYACTTFNELLSCMEAILYSLKEINSVTPATPQAELAPSPVQEIEPIMPDEEIESEPIQETEMEPIQKFENFKSR